MEPQTRPPKVAPKDRSETIKDTATIAVGVGALGTAVAAGSAASSLNAMAAGQAGVTEQLAEVAASQADVAVGLGELADAEVAGSIISAAGEIIGGVLGFLSIFR